MQVGLPWNHIYTSERGSNMAGESHGIAFQHVNARNEDLMMVSPDSLEEYLCRTPNWYLSRTEIEDNSPSRKDGIDSKKETQLRSLYCSFVQDLGMKLKVPQLTIATAMIFCHRFYLHQSHGKNDWKTVATVSIFLACKVEETPRPLVDVIVAAYEMLYRSDRVSAQRIKQKDVFDRQKKLILTGERLLMATVGFDFNIQHPYKPLVAALKKLDISNKDLAQVAWNFVNDWLRTTLCLQYKPHYIAAGSLYLAAKFCKVKLPSERGNAWWQEFEVSHHQLEEVIKHMLKVLGENKKMQKSSSHQKGTCETLVKKATIYSPETNALDGYKATNQSKHVTEEKAKVCGNYRKPSDGSLHSQTFPGEDSCVVRSGGLSQCQTSDSGSSRSGVEDGNRTDDDGDREKLVKPNQIAACMIVTECRGDTDHVMYSGVDRKTEVGGKSDDASLRHSQAVPCDEDYVVGNGEVSQCQTDDLRCSQSVVRDDNRTDDVGNGNRTDDIRDPTKLDGPDQRACLNMGSEPKSNIDNDVDSGIKENVGLGEEFGQSNDAGIHNVQAGPTEDTCARRSGDASNFQTESTKNGVEEGVKIVDSEDLAKLDVTDQTAACNTSPDSGTKTDKGSDCGGLCKIDTDRIKEALRKRKREKLEKVRAALDNGKDSDSWIVEELENGIELEASSGQKRQKL